MIERRFGDRRCTEIAVCQFTFAEHFAAADDVCVGRPQRRGKFPEVVISLLVHHRADVVFHPGRVANRDRVGDFLQLLYQGVGDFVFDINPR